MTAIFHLDIGGGLRMAACHPHLSRPTPESWLMTEDESAVTCRRCRRSMLAQLEHDFADDLDAQVQREKVARIPPAGGRQTPARWP